MRKLFALSAVSAAVVAGCATGPAMSPAEFTECMQPNRRVVVELNGMAPAPAPKPPSGATAKPPAKPQFVPVGLRAMAQGNAAFDPGSAVLKEGGKQDLDALIGPVAKRGIAVRSVIVAGHSDSMEAGNQKNLSEARAKSVVAYLVSRGVDEKLVFWEGREAREPVPVTKFCGGQTTESSTISSDGIY